MCSNGNAWMVGLEDASRERETSLAQETAASGDEDEQRAKVSIQQAKNDQLFVSIRKTRPESTIIQEIKDVLDAGAEINALNARGKTVVDIARQKQYASLEKYLIGRGGKAAADLQHSNDNGYQNIGVNNTIQQSIVNLDLEAIRNLEQKQPLTYIDIDKKRWDLDALLLKHCNRTLTKDKLEVLNAKLIFELEIQEVKKAFKRCGIDVNHQDSRSKSSAVDVAWEYGYYNAMLLLLEADSRFPIDFSVCLDEFYKNHDIPETLKTFVRKRQALHECIRNNDCEKVQNFASEHPMATLFNCENKSALEIAAEFANIKTLASLIALEETPEEATISEEQSKLLKQLNNQGNTLLSIAAKCGNKETVEFLIRFDICINHCNKFGDSAIDLAWCNGQFDVVKILLDADSHFPKEFNLDSLNVPQANSLKQFVIGRNLLHTFIRENNLLEIKQFTATNKSMLYLNSDGESALVTSLKSKSFDIYAFLKSKGLIFKTEDEEEYINTLPLPEKDALKTSMIREFPRVDKGHILFLISKSRSKKPVKNFKDRIDNLYRRLDDIPEVTIILQVLQYIDYIDIVFDFENENIKDINPTASEYTKGTTDYKDGRIYIATRRDCDDDGLAGTLAHELTHLALYIVYKNDCNPFDEHGNFRHRFEEITAAIRKRLRYIVDNISSYEDNAIITMARAFLYPENEQQSELIVRVPHILAQYSATGRNLLVTCKEFKLLFDYYNDLEEGGLLYRCNEVIKNNFLIKPRKNIQTFNETLGKIDDYLKHRIHFENCIDFNIFLKTKRVFLLETKSTFLSMLNVYESLIVRNKNYSLQDCLFVEFNSYLKKEVEVLQLFCSAAGKILCLSCSCCSNRKQLTNALNTLDKLLNLLRDKKVIFVIQESETDLLVQITSIFNENYEKFIQYNFTFNDFTKESQQMILEREITFLGENTVLRKLINISDEKSISIFETDILVKLIKGERIEIGRKPPDTSDLEGAYSKLFHKVDINAFVDKLLEKKSNEVFIISGMRKQDDLVSFLTHRIEDIDKLTEVNNLKANIEFLDVQNVARDIKKSIQVTGNEFKSQHFKQICYNSSAKKIYWINLENDINESKFVLQQTYNPDFYVTGKRISREVVIEKSAFIELTTSKLSEIFVISMDQKTDIQNWLSLNNEQEIQFKLNVQNNKISFVYIQNYVEKYFPKKNEENQTVHLLRFKADHLVWYKSYGSFNTLIKYRAKDYRNIEPLIYENDAIKIIQDNKVSIIAGDPGAGKSTIITRLYNTTFLSQFGQEGSMVKSYWIIKVNLKDQIAIIKKMSFNDLSEIIDFLLNAERNLKDGTVKTFAKNLIGFSLQKKNFVKPLLIVFDGFDEVLDETNRNKVISLLQYLKDKTHAKFCITTRLHYEEDLEDALSTFAIRLESMDDLTIRKFIKSFFSNRLSLNLSKNKFAHFFDTNGKGMLKYIEAFLCKMQKVFKNNITKFIGTPLQLHLMLENSIDSFEKWIKEDSENPDLSYLGNDIWDVYETFVNKKYTYTYKTKTQAKEERIHQEDMKNIDKYHTDIAKRLIIFKSNVNVTLNLEIILSAGIIRYDGNQLGFIHPTFAEYFAAKAFVYWIRKWKIKSYCGLLNYKKQKFFFEIILREPDYRVVRAFLNAKLSKEELKNVELKEKYFNEYIVRRAIKENHVGILKFLLNNFPVDQYLEINSCNFLKVASASARLEILKLLLEKGADVNGKDTNGRTALYLAVEYGYIKNVKLLIDKGAKVNILDNYGKTILYVAAKYGRLDIIKLLFDKGADLSFALENENQTALKIAAKLGHNKIVKILIEKGAEVNDMNEYLETALCSAAYNGHFKTVKLLVEQGANVNTTRPDGRSALYLAVEAGRLDIVTLLVDNGANLNFALDNELLSPLQRALKCGHLEIAKLLIDKGADVNIEPKNNRTALYVAAANGYLEMVKLILEKGAKVNILVKNQDRPLNVAAARGHLDVVELLIEQGADVNGVNARGWTSLYAASVYGYLEIVKLLIQHGANVEFVSNDGRTALHAAVPGGHLEIVKFLIEKGANVTAKDKKGRTPLHLATNNGIVEVLKAASLNCIDDSSSCYCSVV